MFSGTTIASGKREYVRFEILDFNGKALSKVVPARHKEADVFMYCGALAMGANSEVLTFPEEVQADGMPSAQLLPDWSTEQVLPWAARPDQDVVVRRVYCEMAGLGHPKIPVVPRTICARLLEELRAFEGKGLELLVGGELEFTVAKPTPSGDGWRPLFEGVDIFATLQNEKSMDFCYELERQMEPVGVDVRTINAEYGAGQIEVTFTPKFGIEALDATATFRTGTKEIAQRRGLRASFMAKPFGVRGVGNGGHFNFSLWTHAPPTRIFGAVLASSGRPGGDAIAAVTAGSSNALHSPEDADGLSDVARHFLAGVLAHVPAMEAVCSPTPPCYSRHGNWAPVVADWGHDDRTSCVRIKASKAAKPECCYMELRLPSASANPHLVAAALVAAGLDGLQRQLPLPPPRQTKEQGAAQIPATLPAALAALEADEYMVNALGPDFVRWFCLVKRAEIAAVDKRAAEGEGGDEALGRAWQHMYMEFL